MDRNTQALLVKLPADRVTALIARGVGESFAPAGRVFREWVALPRVDRRRWRALLAQAMRFAAGPASPRSAAGAGSGQPGGPRFAR